MQKINEREKKIIKILKKILRLKIKVNGDMNERC